MRSNGIERDNGFDLFTNVDLMASISNKKDGELTLKVNFQKMYDIGYSRFVKLMYV